MQLMQQTRKQLTWTTKAHFAENDDNGANLRLRSFTISPILSLNVSTTEVRTLWKKTKLHLDNEWKTFRSKLKTQISDLFWHSAVAFFLFV